MYMGVKNLPEIARRLTEAGRDPAEPAAAVERGRWAASATRSRPSARWPTRWPRRG